MSARLLVPTLIALAMAACARGESSLPVETAVLTAPPNVPAPIQRTMPARVVVSLAVVEKTLRLADSVTYRFWTFGGTVPGSFIRVREGDLVELHLKNADSNSLPHNIDLHAVTGPGGGAGATVTLPGKESIFTFRALNPGLYVYHCAMPGMVATHVANGMTGLILVQPKEELAAVDHEYYVMQNDIYTKGKNGEPGLQDFDFDKAIAENPEYVVFNGSVGSLTADHALQARVGETVRLFVGNGGPNLTSSFHVIGEIFDHVYQEGGTRVTQDNVQTTVVPPGGAAIVEFKTQVPGNYLLVDHAIFRVMRGAAGMLHIEGKDDPDVFGGPTTGVMKH